jgi:hypothetical protein
VPKVVGRVDARRPVLVDHQGRVVRLVERDAARADMAQELAREVLRHHVVRRCLEREHGEMAGGDLVVEPGKAVARDRRREDQHLAQHDERNRKEQQARREAAEECRALPHPNHRSSRTIFRVRAEKSFGRKKLPAARLPASPSVG